MARSAIGSIKTRIRKAERAIEKKKAIHAKKAEKEKLLRELKSKQSTLAKLRK